MSAGAVGLVAGEGRLPEVLAAAIRARGRFLVCVQMVGDNPSLEALADVFAALGPERWDEMIALWRRHDVHEVVLAGRFHRAEVLARVWPDDAARLAFVEQLPDRRDSHVLDAAIRQLAQHGIRVVDQLAYIRDHVVPPGLLAGGAVTEAERQDVVVGLSVARALAAQDVGQTVVLRRGVILAVEAADGTDATIRRGGEMAPGVVVVKVSRPRQDPRFDVPTVGPETIETMQAARARVLAIEAHRTIVLDRPRLIAAAEAARISVLAVDAPPLVPVAEEDRRP